MGRGNRENVCFFFYRPSPVKLSPLGEKVRGTISRTAKRGTISRTVGGWPFWCEEGGAKVVPATSLKLSVGAKYRFWGGGGTISRGRVGIVQKEKKSL